MKEYQHYKKISQLIAEDAVGSLEKDDKCELENWINESPANKALYYRIKNSAGYNNWKSGYEDKSIENDWKNYYNSIQEQKKRVTIRSLLKYAAFIAFPVLIATGGYFLFFNSSENTPVNLQAQFIKPGSTKAVLTLNDGKSVVLDTPESMILKEKDGTNIKKSEGFISYENQKTEKKDEIIYNTITTPRGGEYVLILADGTKVYLNSVTELKYPVSFQGNTREVELIGEAYFEIAPDKSKPFIVKTGNLFTEALGTIFNINAYKNSGKIITTLIEGTVKIETANKNQSRILNPEDQAVFDFNANSLTVNKVDVMLYTAWKNGEFIFRNERLDNIMETLTRWYSSDVEFQDPYVKELLFSGSLNRYGDIQPILDIIQSTAKVEIEINQNDIILKNKK